MAVTQNTYTGNGSTTIYSLSFSYLDKADVKVTVNNVLVTNYIFATASSIQFSTAPSAGAAIRIYRDTDTDQTKATFFAGSAIKAKDLNSNFTQTLYAVQEIAFNALSKIGDTMQGILNMGGFKITNLGTPTSSTDASTKAYVDGLISTGAANAAAAAASASAAAGSASSAAASYDAFDDRYLGSKPTDPALDNDGNALITGAIYFNTSSNVMRVYNGATWQDASANANVLRWRKTAVGGETSLSGADDNAATLTYTVNLEFVYLNGALLTRGVDYTASNGTSITGLVALEAGDVVEVLSYSSFSLVNVPGSTIQDGTISTQKFAPGAVVGASFTQAGTGAVTRTVDSKLKDVVSVKDFGAVGDGVANDTAAIQAALSSGAKCVTFVGGQTYKVQTALTAPSNLVIQGNGATITASIHFTILTVGSGASIFSLNFTGAGSASYVAGSTAIACVGTNNAPAVPTYVTGPTIENCRISGFGEYAVWLAYVKGGRIAGNSINNIGYAGVGGVSCEDVIVDGNTIKTISPGTPGGDAYGIFIDRNDGTSEVAWPRSYRCVITNNTIENVTASAADNGQGIDTHGGVSFVIDSNVIKNCECGIFLTASSISGSQALGPKQCIVSNNVIEGGVNSIGYGIVVYGARSGVTVIEYAEDCVVSGNIVTGHGKQNEVAINATLFSATKNLNVTGNIFKRSVGSCIFLDFQNISSNINSNTFVDPYDNTYVAPNCVHVYSIDNRGYIGGNVYRHENAGLGTYVAVNSVRIESGLTGLDLDFGHSSFQGIDATLLSVSLGTTAGVYTNGLYRQSGGGTIAVSSGVADGITDVTFAKRFPYIPKVSVALRRPFNQGGKFPILGVDTSVVISATGFRIYALPADGTTWSASGTLSFDYFAS